MDESIDNTVTLKTELRKRDASTVLESVGTGLADTQKAKLVKLSESVTFKDETQYTNEMKTLRKTFIDDKSVNEETVKPAVITEEKVSMDEQEKPKSPLFFQL